MENLTLDIQAPLNTKGGIGLFVKEQDNLPIGSRHGESTSFVSLLDEKTTQVINDKPDMEQIKESPERDTTNFEFSGLPLSVLLPFETGHKLWRSTPLSNTEDIKILPLTDEAKSAVLSLPMINTKRNISGGIQKPTMPVPTEMTDQAQPVIQHSSDEDSLMTVVSRKKSGPLSNEAKLFHLSTTTENTTKNPSDSELKPVIPPTDGIAGQINQTGENSTLFKMVSASATGENMSQKKDPSDAIKTSMTPTIAVIRNNVKSAIPLNMDIKNQAPTDNTGREAMSVALDVTDTDTPFPEVDSLSGDHLTNQIRSAKSEHRTEAEHTDHVVEALRQKDNKPAADNISDLRRMTVSNRDNRAEMATQKAGRYVAAATQKPVPAISDRVAAMGQTVSDDFQVDLSGKAVFMKNSPAGITAADQGNQQIWNVAPDRHHRTTNQDEFPLRTEMTNILSTQGHRSSTTNGPAGIHSQALIDQILDAKQSLNNGFGRVRITLDPPNLGTVNLEIVVRKERVEVVITADNSGVQQALQSRADDIRTALQRQDLKIETFQVLLQENTANHQQQTNSGATFGQRQEHQARQNLMDDITPLQPLMQPIRESETVRGLVSIFV